MKNHEDKDAVTLENRKQLILPQDGIVAHPEDPRELSEKKLPEVIRIQYGQSQYVHTLIDIFPLFQ